MRWLKNIKARYLWITFAVCVVICGIVVYLTTFLNNKTATLIILMILFIFTGTVFEVAISKSFMNKAIKKEYHEVTHEIVLYDDMVKSLRDNAFNSHKMSYGTSFIKIIDDVAYKVIFINDVNKYKEPLESDKNGTKTKGLDDCKRFIGFEIFFDYDEDILDKMRDFSFCGEKVYYEGFYVTDNSLIEPNHVEPLEEFIDNYNMFKEILGIK